MTHWSDDIDTVLEAIHANSLLMFEAHKVRYLYLKKCLRYFKIPIIILSSCNSVLSVGGTGFGINQQIISGIVCLLSLLCGIIGSVELYLALQKQMENDHDASKSYFLLSVSIFKVLSLKKENRYIDCKTFLDESFNEYTRLIENSNLIDDATNTKLFKIPYQNNNLQLIYYKCDESNENDKGDEKNV